MSSMGSSGGSDDAVETPETTTWSANGEHGEHGESDHGVATAVQDAGIDAADSTADSTAEATATEEAIAAEATTTEATTTDHDAPQQDDGSAFLTELARAMRAAATAEKARLAEDGERRRSTHLAVVDTRRKAEASSMRDLAAADLKAIDTWAEDERTRIDDERQRRATALQSDLETSLAEHGAKVDREVEAVEAAITAHQTDVDAFFADLEQETDPVAIAQHASKRPAFPALEAIGTAAVDDAAGTTDQAAEGSPSPLPVMAPPGGAKLAESWAAWSENPAHPSTGETTSGELPEPVAAVEPGRSDDPASLAVSAVGSDNGKVLQSVPSSRPMSWLRRDQNGHDRSDDDR